MSTLKKNKRIKLARQIEIYGDLKPTTGNTITRRGKAKYLGGNGRKTTGISRRLFKKNLQSVRAMEDGQVVRRRVPVSMLRSGLVLKPIIREPFTIVLWGVTNSSLADWAKVAEVKDPASVKDFKGFAGSPGIAEGRARVCRTVDDIRQLQEGEILVAPTTSPSWAPAFAKIKACVTDVGGVMSHAAIVCREYGMPAVVGTGHATKIIQTGMMIRVDGSTGAITVAR